MNELKPCPLCGSSDVCNTWDQQSHNVVYCNSCSLIGSIANNIDEANKLWNTRPIEDALRAELEQARARIAGLESYADKLAAGYPDGMLPQDVKVLKRVNGQLAQELFYAKAKIVELEALLKGIAPFSVWAAEDVDND
jgi:hypothetical protein